MCRHELKPLWYICDHTYEIPTSKVELERTFNSPTGTLAYCMKCGQVFVKEIAEKNLKGKEES